MKEALLRTEQIISVHGDTEIANLPSHIMYGIGNQAESAFQLLRTAVVELFFSIHVIRKVHNSNTALIHVQQAAKNMFENNQNDGSRLIARHCLDTNRFLWFVFLQYTCTCPRSSKYAGCKHAVWATMRFAGDFTHFRVDPCPIAGRRSSGRLRSFGVSYSKLMPSQESLFLL